MKAITFVFTLIGFSLLGGFVTIEVARWIKTQTRPAHYGQLAVSQERTAL